MPAVLGWQKKYNKKKTMSTKYYSKYFAYELTKQCYAHQLEKLSKSIFNETIDLNPYQLDAALFAFRSPLSRGAILADEDGLIISQLWDERKRIYKI